MNESKISDNYSTGIGIDSQYLNTTEESIDNKTKKHYSNSLVIESSTKFVPTDNEFNQLKVSPILKKSTGGKSSLRCSSNMDRRDTYGVQIAPGSKRHKIKFKPQIREVSIVENWKDYNSAEQQTCTCTLI